MPQPMMEFSKNISFICFYFFILVYNNIQKNYREKKKDHLSAKERERWGTKGRSWGGTSVIKTNCMKNIFLIEEKLKEDG